MDGAASLTEIRYELIGDFNGNSDMRFASTIFAAAAIACSAVAIFEFYFIPVASPPIPCEIALAEYDIGTVPISVRKFTTTIRNNSEEPKRIIGITDQCFGNCCFKSMHDAPIVIAPKTVFEYRSELEVTRTGPINAEITFYLEENGIRTVTIRVTGTAVEAPRAPK